MYKGKKFEYPKLVRFNNDIESSYTLEAKKWTAPIQAPFSKGDNFSLFSDMVVFKNIPYEISQVKNIAFFIDEGWLEGAPRYNYHGVLFINLENSQGDTEIVLCANLKKRNPKNISILLFINGYLTRQTKENRYAEYIKKFTKDEHFSYSVKNSLYEKNSHKGSVIVVNPIKKSITCKKFTTHATNNIVMDDEDVGPREVILYKDNSKRFSRKFRFRVHYDDDIMIPFLKNLNNERELDYNSSLFRKTVFVEKDD